MSFFAAKPLGWFWILGSWRAANRTAVLGMALALAVCSARSASGQNPPPTDDNGAAQAPPAPSTTLENTATNQQPAFYVHAELTRPTRDIREGDALGLNVVSEQDAYLYILYEQADGKMFQIYPNEHQKNNRVKAKTPVQVPASADLFRWEVGPPFGKEVVKVIASKNPIERLSRADLKQAQFNPISRAGVKEAAQEVTAQEPNQWAEVDLEIVTYPKDHEAEPDAARRFGVFFGVTEHVFNEQHRRGVQKLTEGKEKGGLNLAGCANDARDLTAMMRGVGQLSDARTFVDAEFTKANLEYAITRWLPSISRPGDTVFIHIASHAGQIDDDNGDEKDGKEEIIIPADFIDVPIMVALMDDAKAGTLDPKVRPRFEQLLAAMQSAKDGKEESQILFRANGVSDDLFARWLQHLSGRQVILIMDTCHSSGFANVEKGLTGSPKGTPIEFDFLEGELPRLKDIGEREQALIAAALTAESAVCLENRKNGVFTAYLMESLLKTTGPVKLEDSYEYCCEFVPKYFTEVNEARQQAGEEPIAPHRQHLVNLCTKPVFMKP